MKNKAIRICILIALAAGLITAARAQTPEYRANISFDFNVGNKTLPAGDYVIALVDFIESRNVLTVRQTKGKESETVMFFPTS